MDQLPMPEKRKVVSACTLFEGVEACDLEAVCATMRSAYAGALSEIQAAGTPAVWLRIAVSGRLEVRRAAHASDEGVRLVLGPGQWIGLSAAWLGGTQPFAVRALDDCVWLEAEAHLLQALCSRRPGLAAGIMRTLARELGAIQAAFEATLPGNVAARLARQLLADAAQYGYPVRDGLRVDLKRTQEDWAAAISLTREDVRGWFARWQAEGLLSAERGYVVIHRLVELRNLEGRGYR